MTGNARDTGTADPQAKLDSLRDRVVAAGGGLGWSPDRVAEFAEALTGTPWSECGDAQLVEVLDEYSALISAVEAKRARKGPVAQPTTEYGNRTGRRGRWAS